MVGKYCPGQGQERRQLLKGKGTDIHGRQGQLLKGEYCPGQLLKGKDNFSRARARTTSQGQGRGQLLKRKAEFRGKGNPAPWRVQTPWHGDEKGGRSLRIYGKDNCQGHDQKAQWTERLTAQWHRAQLHQQQTFCVASSNSSSSSGAAPATELKVAQTEMFAANVALARHRLAEAQQRLVEVEAEADQAEAEAEEADQVEAEEAEAEEADQVEAEEAEEADLEACRLV